MNTRTFCIMVALATFLFLFTADLWAFEGSCIHDQVFSVCYPSDWIVASREEIQRFGQSMGISSEGIKFLTTNGLASVVVIVQEIEQRDFSDEEFESVLRKEFSALQDHGLCDVQDFQFLKRNGMGSVEAVLDTFMFNIPIRQCQFVTVNEGYIYVLAMTARRDDFAYMDKEYFQPILESFTVE